MLLEVLRPESDVYPFGSPQLLVAETCVCLDAATVRPRPLLRYCQTVEFWYRLSCCPRTQSSLLFVFLDKGP